MEVRNNVVCIKVDDKRMCLDPGARMVLDGAMAFLCCALETKEYKSMAVDLVQLMSQAMLRAESKDNQDKPRKGEW
jgi:hypothetical protein